MMSERTFDKYLDRVKADVLKPMMPLWGKPASLRKDECIEVIRNSLKDPAKVQEALSRLQPHEYAALALASKVGGVIDGEGLALQLMAMGFELKGRDFDRYSEPGAVLAEKLIKRGLFLRDSEYSPGYFSSYSYGTEARIFSDHRLLAGVDVRRLHPTPFKLKPAPKPSTTTHLRLPSAVALDLLGVLQAIESIGGIGLTQKGTLRVQDVRKVQRLVKWPEDNALAPTGVHFPDALTALIYAMMHGGLLVYRTTT